MKKLLVFLIGLASSYVGAIQPYGGVQHNYVKLQPSGVEAVEGYFTGVTAGCRFFLPKTGSFCLEGDVHFEGYWNPVVLSGALGQRSRVEEYFAWGALGRCFCLRSLRVRPYVGFGYNYLSRLVDPNTAQLGYHKLFIPVGMTLQYSLWSCGSVGLDVQWRPDVHAHLQLARYYLPLRNKQAFRVQVPLFFPFCWSWCGCPTLAVMPFFDWNAFGRVNQKTSLDVPFERLRLWRWELGVRFVLSLCF